MTMIFFQNIEKDNLIIRKELIEVNMDIYFEKNYGKLYEKIENGSVTIFEMETENGKILNQFIKREVPISLNEKYYDIVTPYGYGGPLIVNCSNKEELLKEYEEQFSKYCLDNNIVSEFVRFHPMVNNGIDFKEIYNSECIKKTLGTNLEIYDDPVSSEFSKSCRRNIRKALEKGITYRVTKTPEDISIFKDIYYSTMDRNNAADYYYFKEEYFNNILKYFKENVLLVEAIFEEKTIACGLYFIYGDVIHIHLSGTLSEYLYLSPAYILRYAVTLWGKENGYKMIHHGGGRTNSEEDTLYTFKKSFAKNTNFDFYVGKKIWNNDIYNKLCSTINIDSDSDFFPAYRKR